MDQYCFVNRGYDVDNTVRAGGGFLALSANGILSMGMMGRSKKTATKYSVSIKKINENFHEMKVDKTLKKGEYAFVLLDMSGMDQSYTLFAFGID